MKIRFYDKSEISLGRESWDNIEELPTIKAWAIDENGDATNKVDLDESQTKSLIEGILNQTMNDESYKMLDFDKIEEIYKEKIEKALDEKYALHKKENTIEGEYIEK